VIVVISVVLVQVVSGDSNQYYLRQVVGKPNLRSYGALWLLSLLEHLFTHWIVALQGIVRTMLLQ